ncbi:23245_t:CDS:2 [Cetraspora pellucida]|uniref:23245_t:CDS:1 n=1 Tax=Cetraspora pellucida TaxID=1433469 RepID=A0A9N8VZG2_9GLOM|nr:23245_t:CDS:2 [Cetraspora pellucida]
MTGDKWFATRNSSPMNDLLDYSVGEQSLANLILDLMSYVIEKKSKQFKQTSKQEDYWRLQGLQGAKLVVLKHSRSDHVKHHRLINCTLVKKTKMFLKSF